MKGNINLISKQINNDLCFIHIPKTAGTALRRIVKKKFINTHDIFFDYGGDSSVTSAEIKYLFYSNIEPSIKMFDVFIRSNKPILIFGHFKSKKYKNYLKSSKLYTFIREPYERVISEYFHHKIRHNLDIDFENYVKESQYSNVISEYLDDIDLEKFAYVGDSRNFTNDLKLILNIENKKLHFFEVLMLNIFKTNKSLVKNQIATLLHENPRLLNKENLRKFIDKSNYKDDVIYEKYNKLLASGTRGRT